MKFYPSNLDRILQALSDNSITSILLHGPDNGVISDVVKVISKKLNKSVRRISPDEINDVASSLSNMSLFNESEIVKIEVKNIRIDNTLKKIVTQINHNLPIFIAEELDASNAFKKFFEAEKSLASIGCYQDEDINIKKIISNLVNKSEKTISIDAINFLTEHIKGNRDYIKNEVAKLILFKGNDPIITIDDVIQVNISANITKGDYLSIFFAKKDSINYLKELDNLIARDVSPVWIVRNIARFYMNLANVKLNEKFGVNIDSSILKLKPRLFFKIIPEFKYIVKKISITEISKILKILTECEINYKKNANSSVLDKLYFANFLEDI